MGAAVEHAAQCAGLAALNFEQIFVTQEDEEDEELTSLADALEALLGWFGQKPFTAADVSEFINDTSHYRHKSHAMRQEFLFAGMPPGLLATPKSVGRRLRNHIDEPVKSGDRTLALRRYQPSHKGPKGGFGYWVDVKKL